MLQVGDAAPGFRLRSDDGKEVSLSDFRGRKVVVYFYPRANTPGCTRQACAVRDVYPEVAVRDIVVIGISPDPPSRLAKFRERHNLPFELLSDPEHRVAEAYGAWGEKRASGKTSMGIIRSHFGIDEGGRVIAIGYKVKPEATAELVRRLASAS
ncbi:MAG: thioredoxin-dependent thiol peroxidase [Anaerolineae bacterium]|nr:thioredoxin-dependent thiol peroxidase [Anaerolineae bacterium]